VLTRKEEKLLRSLARRRVREAEGCFLAEGIRVAEDLLASGLGVEFLLHASSVEDTERGAALLSAARRQGIRTLAVSESEFARLADTQSPQGVIAVGEMRRWSLSEVVVAHDPAGVLVLDAVQDPGNFGALVRTAEALGAAAVFLLPGTVDPWNPKAVRAAMGASFRLPLVEVTWDGAADWMRENSLAVLAADAGGTPLRSPAPRRFALVVGNEGHGITEGTRAVADEIVSIPLRGRAESLNVTAAAAILLHDLLA
jgi:RNA methyltransferase, TrmH family